MSQFASRSPWLSWLCHTLRVLPSFAPSPTQGSFYSSVAAETERAVGGASLKARKQPSWNPDHEHSYSFRAWTQDIELWLMVMPVLEAAMPPANPDTRG
eukprot:7571567-Alexandrium_andersonii.AAC.1